MSMFEDIRGDQKITDWWASVWNDERFKRILAMMERTHPLRFVDTSPVTTPSSDKRLGMIEGYELALERLRLCAEFEKKPDTDIQPTFALPFTEPEPKTP